MGLSDIGGGAGLVNQRRRSPAKPDGLGGVVSNLGDDEGIFDEGWIFQQVDMLRRSAAAGVL